jgi:colanic acid biosynthesis glycosyl transferase WcaI
MSGGETGGIPPVLIVGLNYAPELVGIGPYTAGLAEALAERGAQTSVIAGVPYYPQWQPLHDYAPGEATENGVRVRRVRHYIPAQPSGLKRILHLASFALSALPAALRAARRDRPGAVIVIAPALLSVVTGWIAARLAGAKLWVHVQDFEVEAAVETGLIPRRLAGPALAVEGRILALADVVSTISPQMVARLGGKGVAPGRAIEIRNWADARFVPDPGGARRLRREWSQLGKIVVLYSGNIARKQGIEILVDAARLLASRDDIGFVICGDGPNRAELRDRARGLDNVRLEGLQPAERMGALLAMADIHVLPQIPGAADLVLPSKLTNMLASGRPVAATALPGTGLYDEVDGCGTLTAPGDAAALAAAIAALADDPKHRAALGEAAARRAQERWSKDAVIDRVAAKLRDLA